MTRPGPIDHNVATSTDLQRLALPAAIVTGALVVVTVPVVVVDVLGGYGKQTGEFLIAGFAPGFAIAGLIVARRRPDLPVGWLYLVGGLLSALAGLGAAYTGSALAHGWVGARWGVWVTSWAWFPQTTCAAVAFLVFPDGLPMSPRARRLMIALLALTGATMVLGMVVPGGITTTPGTSDVVRHLHNPLGITFVPGLRVLRDIAEIVSGAGASVAAAVVIVVRFLRSHGERRAQLRWLVPIVVLGVLVPPWLALGQVLLTVLGQAVVTTVIVRHRALDIDMAVRRSVLAAALLAAALGSYLAMVVVVGAAVGHAGPVVSAVAATVAVFAFAPLSVLIRSWVDRLFYGRRAQPYAVVAALGRRLSDAPGPEDGLQALVEALTDELRLPYAEVSATSGVVLVSRGAPERGDHPEVVALDHQGERVGTLRVGHRRGETVMAPAEAELLADLARQVGAAVHAVAVLEDLRRARERLVVAREDERRRLQRDLHDGLGPKLTAVAYKIDAARNRLPAEPHIAQALLRDSSGETRDAVGDIRRLVYALGDPGLESLGLVAAIRDQASRFPATETGLTIDVTAVALEPLPAAVEVAAFRIAAEAINNTVRHAHARRCLVSMSLDGSLHLTVSDDGDGLRAGWTPGVGIRSMTDRAAELGGTCSVVDLATGGTRVDVSLPVDRSQTR
jgi:signal transduction histidine kinase